MDGLDLAFYKGRSRYHTKYDAAQYTLGGEKSLWNMMETARGVGIGLLSVPFDEKRDSDGDVDLQGGSPPIYFDCRYPRSSRLQSTTYPYAVFKSVLIVFPMSKLLTFNIFTLVIGPVLLILLVLSEIILVKRREKAITQEEHVHPTRVHTPPLLQHRSTQSARAQEHPHLGDLRPSHVDENDDGIVDHDKPSAAGHWIHIFWRHVKFWAALVVVIGLQLLLMAGYVLFNPFVRLLTNLHAFHELIYHFAGNLCISVYRALLLPYVGVPRVGVHPHLPIVAAFLLPKATRPLLRRCRSTSRSTTKTYYFSPSISFHLDITRPIYPGDN